MAVGAVLAPGYGGSADQSILVACGERLERVGIRARRMAFTRLRPAGDFGPELDDLRRAREVLRNDGVQKLALVGRSFGGRMCARLAALEPPDALVLLGHPISPPHRPRPDDEAALLAVSCPTLVVQGDNDRLGPLTVLQRIAAANGDIEIYVLGGVGHQFGKRQNEGLDYAAKWLEQRFRG
jgi:predicted alpha/beta-hydrolase family hydrolase